MKIAKIELYQIDLPYRNCAAFDRRCRLAQPYTEDHYDTAKPIKIVDGYIALPETPGLGALPDEARFGAPVALV